ncbi:U11/U12 small nuclear ribonucleoprotein 35 kDa protein-like, partial [Cherax quadricarinatus]|uniref:U11/U12 small nuclear ribonucleoprotein 35 kDa protein-like n=1 Tax=Cherax quadricarinatus TaxID=27406 RepID=UPI00387ECBBC
YDPLAAGSIDGTDTEPHDRAVWRAMNAHYVPPDIRSKPEYTLFVGRLPRNFREDQLSEKFSRFGALQSVHLIRDIVTGHSRGYGFVEFRHERDALHAFRECNGLEIEGHPIIVNWEAGHRMKGWIPRRLGGGWGGRKEAGQLRFGCRDRLWRKPIVIHSKHSSGNTASRGRYRDNSRFIDSRRHRYSDTPVDRGQGSKQQRHQDEGIQERERCYDHRRDRSRDRRDNVSRQRDGHKGKHSSKE